MVKILVVDSNPKDIYSEIFHHSSDGGHQVTCKISELCLRNRIDEARTVVSSKDNTPQIIIVTATVEGNGFGGATLSTGDIVGFIEFIRKECKSGVPIIAFSGDSNKDFGRRVIIAGADYLFTIDEKTQRKAEIVKEKIYPLVVSETKKPLIRVTAPPIATAVKSGTGVSNELWGICFDF